jgi:hypothetical protein
LKCYNDVLVTNCLLPAIDVASSIATRDAALFLPYRSALRNLNNAIGLPTLIFRLMGREIAVEHQDSVSITCLFPAYWKHIVLPDSLILHDFLVLI